jgi:hypothetical protein
MLQIAGSDRFLYHSEEGWGENSNKIHYRFIGINHYFSFGMQFYSSCQNGALKSFPS